MGFRTSLEKEEKRKKKEIFKLKKKMPLWFLSNMIKCDISREGVWDLGMARTREQG